MLLVSQAINADTEKIEIQHSNDPNQKTHSYAGKLYWNARDRVWQKKIIVYKKAPPPPKTHPVWTYVRQIKIPKHYGIKGKDLHYKRFYTTGNCAKKTPLAKNKPWHIDFNRDTLGAYKAGEAREDWGCPQWMMGVNLLTVVGSPQAYQGKALRLQYLKGIGRCVNGQRCINWKTKLDKPFDRLYFGYRFKFANGFPFVKGGKLPGIGGGTSNTNGKIPTGYDGWSVRMMWGKQGELVQYVYHPNQPSQFGDIMPLAIPPINRGKWYTVQTLVQLNQAGKKNGLIRTWINGKVVLNRANMYFRKGNNLKIDRLLFASFYGGNGPQWAPKQNSYSFIDDVRLSPNPVFY
jgi:hypothetical protein